MKRNNETKRKKWNEIVLRSHIVRINSVVFLSFFFLPQIAMCVCYTGYEMNVSGRKRPNWFAKIKKKIIKRIHVLCVYFICHIISTQYNHTIYKRIDKLNFNHIWGGGHIVVDTSTQLSLFLFFFFHLFLNSTCGIRIIHGKRIK